MRYCFILYVSQMPFYIFNIKTFSSLHNKRQISHNPPIFQAKLFILQWNWRSNVSVWLTISFLIFFMLVRGVWCRKLSKFFYITVVFFRKFSVRNTLQKGQLKHLVAAGPVCQEEEEEKLCPTLGRKWSPISDVVELKRPTISYHAVRRVLGSWGIGAMFAGIKQPGNQICLHT